MRLFFLAICLFGAVLARAEPAALMPNEARMLFRDGLLWVEVDSPGATRPLSFLLDSGASVSVLNQSTAQELRLRLGRPIQVESVGGIVSGYGPIRFSAKANQLQLPGKYLVLDLSQLSGACSCKIDGLIGMDFFRGKAVEIDFKEQMLRVLSTGPGPANATVLPLQSRPCGMRVPVSVNGFESQWVRLDTGCASPLHWVTSQVPDRCSRQTAVALSTLGLPMTETTVKIGTAEFESVPTRLHEREIFSGESGLLGNGLLSRFSSVTVDLKRNRLILQR